ncbi:phenylalanine--tRNA ligase subunit alpha [Picrophilus oshimae]|uniref:phenylalanine--tRNA ligase n=1 Tax=Picrophilus torridus (strain ATCC 700027 / DSM 9790 / JCM 10055 / NBRC 100828 / KAW 2/3) TaxID=1122961 RepID=Q6L2U2_PICTO|nr:phenylalanine--tRNA ligase subunit alpha [Picrophilus oshimae]AAT42710.1 phenylalanyl-tRNA synthetase alpha chain [Picrophilus oshimae DSM 9789]
MEKGISRNEYNVLNFIKNGSWVSESSIKINNMDDRMIASAVSYLESKGYIDVKRSLKKYYYITDEGKKYLENGLPEEIAIKILKERKSIALDELKELISDYKIAISNLARYGIKPNNGLLNYNDAALEKIKMIRSCLENPQECDMETLSLLKRRLLLREKNYNERIIKINDAGLKILNEFNPDIYIDKLTTSMLVNNSWKNVRLRPFDLNPDAGLRGSGLHPLTYLTERIRSIFFDLGFTEMHGHFVEYTAWNMDMLFIPQDHPARDLQDTFYASTDFDYKMENPEIIEIAKSVHEHGINKYPGWGYKFDENESKKLVLRTHTTVNTIRYLYNNRKSPQYIFSIEKVFRHESVDWKHLAEFHQIEGAVYSKDASLSTLKWFMREFYRRLGFDDIKLIPSYYPYTEPSMDVIVKVNGREIELGGSGIFRPEVTKPLGLKYPVFAFGLGLERLAILYYKLNDVRDIYNSDSEWLRSYKINL